jgi:Fur family transcriptional regulator, ferric uptake regulator
MLKFEKILRANSYSVTKPRRLVFEYLQTCDRALSMRELVNELADSIDRASIYRIVSLFEQLGIVQRIRLGWKYKIELSDLFNHHHHHATCMLCGITFTLTENAKLEQLIEQMAETIDFTLQSHDIEIRGTCTRCTKNGPKY